MTERLVLTASRQTLLIQVRDGVFVGMRAWRPQKDWAIEHGLIKEIVRGRYALTDKGKAFVRERCQPNAEKASF
jgi:hypothetical protein